jgi:hypothetical protein
MPLHEGSNSPLSSKSGEVSYILCLFTGLVGGQRFYAGKIGQGLAILLLSLLTGGVVGAATLIWDAWKITHDDFRDKKEHRISFLTPEGKWPKSALLATAGLLALIGGSMASGGLVSMILGVGIIATGIGLAAVAVKRFFFGEGTSRQSFHSNGEPLLAPTSTRSVFNGLQNNPAYNPQSQYTTQPIPTAPGNYVGLQNPLYNPPLPIPGGHYRADTPANSGEMFDEEMPSVELSKQGHRI